MSNAALHSTYLITCCTVISLTTPVLGGDSQPFTITAVVLEGDDVPEFGTVLAINNVAVNNDGEWIVEAETDHAGECPDVLLREGVVLLRECDFLDEPEGAYIFDFGSVNINNSGSSGWEFDLYSEIAIQGVYLNTDLLLLEGDISTAKDFTPGTTYTWFFGTKINNNDPPQILLNVEVDDPNIPGSDDRALVIITPNADGPGVTETVVFKEGDILPGQTEPIILFPSFFANYAMNDAGDVMFGARVEDPILLRVVYINGLLVAEEGGPSPIKGRNWNHLGVTVSVDLNSRGDHVLRGGLDGDSQTSILIARNGQKLVQQGDVLPGTNGAPIRPAGLRPVLINDLGQVLWLARWDNPADDSVLNGLLLDLIFVVREGVPTKEGFVFKSLDPNNAVQTFGMSDNGRYIIFEADLFDNTNGAFLIDFGPACPWDLDGNNDVGVKDLLILLGAWGPCPPKEDCPADLDGDGFVGVLDLLALIANLGECPGTGCPWDVNGDGVVNHLDIIAVNDNMGPCKDPDNCPWDVNGDGVVDGTDVSEVASHFGPCPKV